MRVLAIVAIALGGGLVVFLTSLPSTARRTDSIDTGAIDVDVTDDAIPSAERASERLSIELPPELDPPPTEEREASAPEAEQVADETPSLKSPPLPPVLTVQLPPGVRVDEDSQYCVQIGADGLKRLVNPRTFEVLHEKGYQRLDSFFPVVGYSEDKHGEAIQLDSPSKLPEEIKSRYHVVEPAPHLDGFVGHIGGQGFLMDATGTHLHEGWFQWFAVGASPSGKLAIFGRTAGHAPVLVREIP